MYWEWEGRGVGGEGGWWWRLWECCGGRQSGCGSKGEASAGNEGKERTEPNSTQSDWTEVKSEPGFLLPSPSLPPQHNPPPHSHNLASLPSLLPPSSVPPPRLASIVTACCSPSLHTAAHTSPQPHSLSLFLSLSFLSLFLSFTLSLSLFPVLCLSGSLFFSFPFFSLSLPLSLSFSL